MSLGTSTSWFLEVCGDKGRRILHWETSRVLPWFTLYPDFLVPGSESLEVV